MKQKKPPCVDCKYCNVIAEMLWDEGPFPFVRYECLIRHVKKTKRSPIAGTKIVSKGPSCWRIRWSPWCGFEAKE